MEAVDTARRPNAALPSISFLDLDKIKREEADYQRKNTATAMVSPSFPYSCPPPPYTHAPSSANSASSTHSGLISPPGSRRMSGDDAPSAPAQARQSLPSISEALGSDPLMRYPPPPPPPPLSVSTSAPTSAPSFPPLQSPVSATPDHSRFAHPASSRPSEPAAPPYPPPRPHSPMDSQQPSVPLPGTSFLSQSNPKLPTLHPITTAQSPVSQFRPNLSYSSQGSTQEPQISPLTQTPPYPPYPSPYQHPAPPTPTSAPLYQPPMQSGAPPPAFTSGHWRNDIFNDADRRPVTGKISGPAPAYGEVVKRQLDIFDIEGSLNELAECSGKMLDFSRLYGQRAHQTARSGPVPGSIPSLSDIDDLLAKNQKIRDALMRMKDVVIAQNAAFAEQRKDQGQPVANGYAVEQNGYQPDEAKQGGFAGSDAKKRRGRAAPPGRCHSCNRAETPEWRRGPDGARTLCNACGLHYAKLTRKMGGSKQAIGSSNLRPKGPGSPTV